MGLPDQVFTASGMAGTDLVCAKYLTVWVSRPPAPEVHSLAGPNVPRRYLRSSALPLAQHRASTRARTMIQRGGRRNRDLPFQRLQDRRPSSPGRTMGTQVKSSSTRALLVPWQLFCCCICAIYSELTTWSLVTQGLSCSAHRPLSLMEVRNLGPQHRPVQ